MNDLTRTEPLRVNVLPLDASAQGFIHVLQRMAQAGIYVTPGLNLYCYYNSMRVTIEHSYYTRDPYAWERNLPPLEERRDQLRRLKRLFGPFKQQGDPPYVTLRAHHKTDRFSLEVEIHGAFACEKVGTKKVPVSESQKAHYARESERLARKALETEEEEPVFSCSPALAEHKEIEP